MEIRSGKGLVGAVIEGYAYSFTKGKTLSSKKIKIRVLDKIIINTTEFHGDVYIGVNVNEVGDIESANVKYIPGHCIKRIISLPHSDISCIPESDFKSFLSYVNKLIAITDAIKLKLK
jgi:hypothetical protein